MTNLMPKIIDHEYSTLFAGLNKYLCVTCGFNREDHIPQFMQRAIIAVDEMLLQKYGLPLKHTLEINSEGEQCWNNYPPSWEIKLRWFWGLNCLHVELTKGKTTKIVLFLPDWSKLKITPLLTSPRQHATPNSPAQRAEHD